MLTTGSFALAGSFIRFGYEIYADGYNEVTIPIFCIRERLENGGEAAIGVDHFCVGRPGNGSGENG
jgi:hypothetical protein